MDVGGIHGRLEYVPFGPPLVHVRAFKASKYVGDIYDRVCASRVCVLRVERSMHPLHIFDEKGGLASSKPASVLTRYPDSVIYADGIHGYLDYVSVRLPLVHVHVFREERVVCLDTYSCSADLEIISSS